MTPYIMERYLENATGFTVHIADCHDAGPLKYKPPHPNVFKAFSMAMARWIQRKSES